MLQATSTAMPGSVTRADRHAAWYEDPTDRYGHGIMGGVQDALTLRLAIEIDGRCRVHGIAVGDGFVFEDTAPRLVDLEGDGLPEVVAVRASMTRGAQLAIYGLRRAQLTQIGGTPHIGTRFRWLAPSAWEDLDGDGHVELAYVDRPHLAKTLRIWRWRSGRLEEVAELPGVTNHAIGEETIRGFTRTCDRGREMVLQSADRSRLVGVILQDNTLIPRDLGPAREMEARRTC